MAVPTENTNANASDSENTRATVMRFSKAVRYPAGFVLAARRSQKPAAARSVTTACKLDVRPGHAATCPSRDIPDDVIAGIDAAARRLGIFARRVRPTPPRRHGGQRSAGHHRRSGVVRQSVRRPRRRRRHAPGVGVTGWLVDKSALVRLAASADVEEWSNRIGRGLVRVSTVTRLEVGFSARSGADLRHAASRPPYTSMPVEYLTPVIEDRAVEVQMLLADLVSVVVSRYPTCSLPPPQSQAGSSCSTWTGTST